MDATLLERIGRWQDALVVEKRLPMAMSLISYNGKTQYFHASGYANVETKEPVNKDHIFRLHSMTKPIVAVGLCMLYEEAMFQIDDPVYYFLGPQWKKENMKVFSNWIDRKACTYETVPCKHDITMRHILTHTAGLSHGFDPSGKGIQVDRIYAKKWRKPKHPSKMSEKERATLLKNDPSLLKSYVDGLASMPLLYQPGEQWNYSHAPDVQARLIEVLSGLPVDQYLQQNVFDRVGMVDTSFDVPLSKVNRFTKQYTYTSPIVNEKNKNNINEWNRNNALTFPHVGSYRVLDNNSYDKQYLNTNRPKLLSGAGGLVGTIHDYAAFCNMLLAGGFAEKTGERILGVKTIEFMTSNHLPNNKGLLDMIIDPKVQYSETAANGGGFGLGFSVVQSPVVAGLIGSPGNFAWGGAASTIFWCDPIENISVVFFTQVLGMRPLNQLRAKLGSMVYASITDRRLGAAVAPATSHVLQLGLEKVMNSSGGGGSSSSSTNTSS